MTSPVLYLDYDGVLHPADVRVTPAEPLQPRVYVRGVATARPLFEHVRLLESLLQPFPAVRIVLATSWVRQFGFTFALEQLTPALQARVIGATTYPAPARFFCIQIDVEERGIEHWLALDDDLNLWPESELHRVVAPTDRMLGLAQPGIAQQLSVALARLCSRPPN